MIITALSALPGVAFDQAVSGLEAIERITLSPVDLMILDLNMPDVHGLEVLRFVRAHPSLAALPVVVLTTRGDEASRRAALAEGASLYLTKPFEPASIVPQIESLLGAGKP